MQEQERTGERPTMAFDDELEKIQRRKLEEMMRKKNAPEAKPQAAGIPAGVMNLTDATFSATVGKYPLTVVDFWAPWCGPCRMVSPVVEELSRDYSGRAAFGKVNVDENPVVSSSFGIQSIPTIMFFSKGRAVDAVIGAVPKQVLEARMKPHIAGPAS